MNCVLICFLFLLKTISTSNTIENTVTTADDPTTSTKNQERSVRYANGQDVTIPISSPHVFVPNTNYYHNPQATIPQQPQVYDGNYNRYQQPSYEEELK